MNAVEAVFRQEFLQREIGGANKRFAGFLQPFDMIYRKRNDALAFIIVADDFQRGSIGIEIHGVRIEQSLFGFATVQGAVTHPNAVAIHRSIRQPINLVGEGRVIFGGDGCRAENIG